MTSLYGVMLFLVMSHLSEGTDTIIRPGPSSGIMVQETLGFILIDRRMKTQKVCLSVDPQPSIEKRFDVKNIQSPEITAWYEMHLKRTKDHIRDILEQARKPFTSAAIPHTHRKKRFVGALIATAIFSALGTVVATGISAVNTISIKKLEIEMDNLRHNMNVIRRQLQSQKEGLLDVVSVVNDTVVTINLHSELITRSTNLHQSHELFKRELLSIQEPLLFYSLSFISEIQHSMDYLIQGHIPLYFVPNSMIKTLLTEETGDEVNDFQINLAFEMGSAIPLHIDPEGHIVCFLLTIPYISTQNVYQIKKVHNVGTWKENIHIQIQTPNVIAYQPWNPDIYMIPILTDCLRFKDNNFQCNGNPFVYDVTHALCGIEYQTHGSEKCQVSMRKSEDQEEVQAILIQDDWLVSTALKNMSIFYKDRIVSRMIMIPTPVSLIKVPQNARITIGKMTLYPSGMNIWEGTVEDIDAFQNIDIPINADLQFLLNHKPNHTLQMLIKKDNISIDTYDYSEKDNVMLNTRAWMLPFNLSIYVMVGLMGVWLIILTGILVRMLVDKKKNPTTVVRFTPVLG